jgi:hypothetical protein
MSPAAQFVENSGSLDLSLECLERPLEAIGLGENDFRHDLPRRVESDVAKSDQPFALFVPQCEP